MKKWMTLFLVLLLTAAMFCALAEEEPVEYTSGDYEYILLEDGTAEITDYTGKATELTVPSELDGYCVSSIGDEAFYACDSLTRISLPDSIVSIRINPFVSCDALTSIIVSPDHPVLATIDGVLFNKTEKSLICYPWAFTAQSYAVPQGIRAIGDRAFYSCDSLSSIYLPTSIISIRDEAFYKCGSLTSIALPDSISYIGYGSFAFSKSLTSIALPTSITSIGNYAFFACDSLTNISLPDSLTSIGDYLFYGCDSLISISLPTSIISIGECSFAHCYCLTNVTIPPSITAIGDGAFHACDRLTLTVERDSYARQYCKDNNLPYTYPDANDWLLN